ncbi:family 65 glycosyl hydrolase, partial [Clostridium neonatale]|nr:family 65 glycosyl hydrolase [Clostridium neonatale]
MENLIYNYGKNEEKNWIITERIFDNRYLGKCESIFTQGNGYLGVRNSLDESYIGEKRNLFVTGTFNKASEDEVTELPNFPDVTNIEISINGRRLNLNYGEVKDYSRSINLRTGESTRKFIWCGENGLETKFTFKRFVSLENEHLIASSVEIENNKDINLVITTGIN